MEEKNTADVSNVFSMIRKIPDISDSEAYEFATKFNKLDNMATRDDIDKLKVATRADIDKLKVATRADIAILKAEINGKIEKSMKSTIIWLGGFIVAYSGVLIAIFRFF